ncbi:MAG TPA: HD domain-containing phosphohydrolase, partial [Solirubrobacteraceae bacterium]
ALVWSRVDGVSVAHRLRHDFIPVFPWELVTALLTVAVASIYEFVGLPALALATVVILTFQYLLRELLTSQRRAEELEARTTQLGALQVGVMAAMVQTLGLRDRMTARHSAAVARFAREIAAATGRTEIEQELVHTAGLLHDIGKFALPDAILLGQRPLSEEDWARIRRHPEDGARVVRRVDGYGPVADIILLHHERLDGHGYPYGLKGEDIPLFARMLAVADAYDVMTARDSYRATMTSGEACAELRRCAGTQFDPAIVETFITLLERRDLAFRHADDADFERELGFERRVQDYARGSA